MRSGDNVFKHTLLHEVGKGVHFWREVDPLMDLCGAIGTIGAH
jgi:hypothetical protein